jgi:hypothetical protein
MSTEPIKLPDEPFENILARFTRVPSTRIETETHIIYQEPRITAALLGQYIVSDPSRQKTILKNSKFARKGMMFGYSKARHAVSMSLVGGVLSRDEVTRRADSLADESAEGMQKKENLLSVAALREFVKMDEFPVIDGATKIKRPKSGWDKLAMNGVQVTFEPQIVFSFIEKKVTKVGGVIFHPTKTVPLDREQNELKAGDYAAVLLLKMLADELSSVGVPSPSNCFVSDVYRGHTYTAPKSYKTMLKHLEDACGVIASLWSGIRQ